jgi:hypothetical protein
VKFGRWYPLVDAASQAPGGPGVFQVRVADGLLDYPRGKSAMVHYEAAADVRAAAVAFAARHRDRDWLCRHTIEMTADEAAGADGLAARLVRDFATRFGQPPTVPSVPAAEGHP